MSERPASDDRRDLPVGVVSFLMTDVESSTRLWREAPGAAAVMARQAELIAAAVARHGGVRPLEQGEGDSIVAVFVMPSDALSAAAEAQCALQTEPWPDGARLRVRMAVHTGEAELRDDHTYGGESIIRCARIRGLARGGQVLVSNATAALTGRLPDGATLVELQTVTLDGFDRPERVHQLCHRDLPADFAPLRYARADALPPWPTPLVGRERERQELTDLLTSSRLVTVTGAGGSGKTRLAHAVASDLAERWANGVAWVELARLSAGVQVAGAVATACGVPEVPGLPTIDLLERHLAKTEVLIVLDNCEHLLEDCSRVADVAVRAGSGVTVLATSREPLGVTSEVTWRIPSLALSPEDERDPERIGSFDAVRLFVERARAAQPDFQLDAATAPAVAAICRRLDGIPLALELAAARVRAFSVARLADGLDDRFRLLTGGARTAMARQRTLLASVEWSHGLLDEQERTLFRRLGVFASPFSLEAAEAVAADESLDPFVVLDVLARLVDKSLVQHTSDRYRLLETLRQYALERAADAGELADLRDRHMVWCRRRAAQWRLDREVATEGVLDEVAAEAPDLIVALEWSLGPGKKLAADLLHPLAEHWGRRYPKDEVRAVAAKILGTLEEGSPAWLEALAPVALDLLFVGELGWLPAARRALDTIGAELDPGVRGLVEQAVSMGFAMIGRPEGIAGMRRAVDDARAAGNRALECSATARLAATFTWFGDCAAARPLLAWLDRHLPPDAWYRFLVDGAHAATAAHAGDFEGAKRHLAAHLGSRFTGVAVLAGTIGQSSEDAALLKQAIANAESVDVGGPFGGTDRRLRGLLSLLDGDPEAARRQLEAGLAGQSFGGGSLWLRHTLAEVHLSLGDPGAAEAQLAELEPQLKGVELHWLIALVDLLRAHLDRGRGEQAAAEAHAHDGLTRALDHELALTTTDALEALALLAADAGSDVEAARLLGAAEAFRRRSGYTWRYPYCRRAVDELQPRLDATHLDEGRSLSLTEAAEYARRGRGERGRPNHGWESLTPSEQRVVELVAAGLPNRDIAAKLFVSLATVKTHLVHVYAKLDVRTRTELAAAATRRGIETP